MVETGSVTELLRHLRQGDRCAAEGLWRCYFHRMSARARQHLLGERAVADEEDAALSAFDTFCRHVSEGQFERVANRNELWALLVVLTRRKVTKYRRHELRQKRGGSRRRPIGTTNDQHSEAMGWSGIKDIRGMAAVGDRLDAHCQELLELLPEEPLRQIAIRRLEGFSTQEIATELNMALRSIERKLSRIRSLWCEELSS